MSGQEFVIAITGPSGSGKSTVGEKLAKQLKRCVNIDADHIKHMIVSGFSYETNPDGKKEWSFNEWNLVGDSIGLLAQNFLKNKYSVIINGYVDRPGWLEIQKHIALTYKVLLLPHVDTTIQRDKQRRDDIMMGEDTVKKHHAHFSSNVFFSDFTKIDSSDKSVDETISEIRRILENKGQ